MNDILYNVVTGDHIPAELTLSVEKSAMLSINDGSVKEGRLEWSALSKEDLAYYY